MLSTSAGDVVFVPDDPPRLGCIAVLGPPGRDPSYGARADVVVPVGAGVRRMRRPARLSRLGSGRARSTGHPRALTRGRSHAHNGMVTAIAWTLVGLTGASFGLLATVLIAGMSRIDGLGASLGARIDAQGASLGARIDAQGATLGARIDAQASDLRAELRGLRESVHELDVRLTHSAG